MATPRKQSAQSDAELPDEAPPAEDSGGMIESSQESAPSAPAAPEISLEMPREQGQRTLLTYTGNDLVVVPFGELHAGEVVAAPDYLIESLTRTGLFIEYDGEPVDQDTVRHP